VSQSQSSPEATWIKHCSNICIIMVLQTLTKLKLENKTFLKRWTS